MSGDDPLLDIERPRPGVALLTMGSEEKYVSLSPRLLTELGAKLDQLAMESAVRAIVIRGNTHGFCVGANLKVRTGQTALQTGEYVRRIVALMDQIRRLPKLVVAAVHGRAMGGGFELALACDIRIATGSAIFALPEAKLGSMAVAGAVQRLSQFIGFARASALCLLADELDGDTAQAWGLVYRAVPDDATLLEVALGVAATGAERSPISIALGKSALRWYQGMDEGTAMEVGVLQAMMANALPDRKEGSQAFFEKRAPRFPGFAGAGEGLE